MVEAMACGTPVLAMPGGSVPEVVREGVSGHICRNVREMSNRVRNLNFKPAAVRAYVEQNFSIDKMASRYTALYEDILADRAPESTVRNHVA
jgi:glycosyltransferase involved in cell wall biosynthesis